MLGADDLPELGSDLVTALPGLDVQDLTHGGERERERKTEGRSEMEMEVEARKLGS